MTTTKIKRRKIGAGEAADQGAGQCSAQARAVGAASGDLEKRRRGDGESEPVVAGLPVSHCRGRLAYWLRSKRRLMRDMREFGDEVGAEILAIYATSIRYWRDKVNAGGVA